MNGAGLGSAQLAFLLQFVAELRNKLRRSEGFWLGQHCFSFSFFSFLYPYHSLSQPGLAFGMVSTWLPWNWHDMQMVGMTFGGSLTLAEMQHGVS